MPDLLLAQITDTHALNPDVASDSMVDNNARLTATVDALLREDPAPSLILHTGDATDNSRPGEFDELERQLERVRPRVRMLPGNHDERIELRRRFPDQAWADAEHGSWTDEIAGIRIIGLDSTEPGEHGGHLDEERLRWLDTELRRSGLPTVLCVHHPPFRSGLAWMDDGRIRPEGALDEIVAAAPHLERIWCGHLHRPITTTVGGVTTQTCPTTSQPVALDLRPGQTISMITEPAAYNLHLRTEGGWVTHTRFVGLGVDPIVPDWAI